MLSNCSSYKNWWDSYESKAVVSFQLIYFYMYTYYWGHACFHLKLCSKQILNMTEQIASHFLEYLKNNKRQAALHCKHNMLQHLRAESQLTRLVVTPVKWLLLSVCSLTLPEVNPSFPTFPLFLHLFFFFLPSFVPFSFSFFPFSNSHCYSGVTTRKIIMVKMGRETNRQGGACKCPNETMGPRLHYSDRGNSNTGASGSVFLVQNANGAVKG